MNKAWTDQDLDNLIASVEESIGKAEVLAKSSLKKGFPQQDQDDAQAPAADTSAPDAQAAPPQMADDQAPPEQGAADQMPPDQAAPTDQAAPPQEGDQALEQGEDAPLSDEELSQIYGSMAPDELERHYAVIRQQLQSAYGEDQGQQQAPDQMAQPEQQAAPEQSAPPQQAAPQESPDFGKSEKMISLEKKVQEQAQALEQITKAFEVLAKPARKSITDIQFIAKSEESIVSNKTLTKTELKDAVRKLAPETLTKGERDLINSFYLRDENQNEVQKLINSKGGK